MKLLTEYSLQHDAADHLIRSIYTNGMGWSARRNALQQKIRCGYATVAGDSDAGLAWDTLLSKLRTGSEMVSIEPVVAALGPRPGNTFLDALLHCALRQREWHRSLERWTPLADMPPKRQFHHLIRHLFCAYPVPEFFDMTWFEGFRDVGAQHRDWFLKIGGGQNIRRASLPVQLTEKMAHHALLAPADSTIVGALRFGQTLGLGGDPELAQTIGESRLRDILPDEPFWESAIHFFVNYADGRLDLVGPMIDYLFTQKYGEALRILPDGAVDTSNAADPDISMKGRKWSALKERMDDWHEQLARDALRPKSVWEPSGIGGLAVTIPDPDGQMCHWTVTELLNTTALMAEAREQRNCVLSYATACKNGVTSIFSLRVRGDSNTYTKRLLTVEVNTSRRAIVQVRGRCNMTPAEYRGNDRIQTARSLLHQWAHQERLYVACSA